MSNPITLVWLFKNSIQFYIDNNNNNQTTMIKLGPITPSYPTQSLLDDQIKFNCPHLSNLVARWPSKRKKMNGHDQI